MDRSEQLYNYQRRSAKKRNIAWQLTYKEWYNWWLSNGIDKNKDFEPMSAQKLCMCRYNDSGPYALHNIYCSTNSDNVKLRNKIYHSKKTLITPYGVFHSARQASKTIGCHENTVRRKIKSDPSNYYFQ